MNGRKQRRHGDMRKLSENVFEMAKARVRHAIETADDFVVMFSGGKDSTAVLNVTLEVAREMKRGPVKVFFGDEEAISPDTVDYVRRVYNRPDVEMFWCCVPTKHRNACSRRLPWWYAWAPEDEDKWCRPLPPESMNHNHFPDVPRTAYNDQLGYYFPAEKHGTISILFGRRTQESLIRYRMITAKRGFEAFIRADNTWKHIYRCDPIYDWKTEDVWIGPLEHGWDYNRTYDLFHRVGVPVVNQRVTPPFGEEPSANLWFWKKLYPDLWDKMQSRVPGADCAARYSNSALYAKRDRSCVMPREGETWRDYIRGLIMQWPNKERAYISDNIRRLLKYHSDTRPGVPIPDIEPDPKTMISWQRLAMIAFRGMLKGRTLSQYFSQK